MTEVKLLTTCITYVNTCTKNKFLITLAFDKWNLKDLEEFYGLKADLHLHTSVLMVNCLSSVAYPCL